MTLSQRDLTIIALEEYGMSPEVAGRFIERIASGAIPTLTYKPRTLIRSNAKCTLDQILNVCQVLQDKPKLSLRQVSRVTKVGFGTVSTIYRRSSWQDISEKFDFTAHQEYFSKYCKGSCLGPDYNKSKEFKGVRKTR